MEIHTDDEVIHVGIVVDAVSEVLSITEKEIEPPPAFGTTLSTDYILGLAKTEDSVKILLNIDKILSQADMSAVQKASDT